MREEYLALERGDFNGLEQLESRAFECLEFLID
jgi:hypothetical protein